MTVIGQAPINRKGQGKTMPLQPQSGLGQSVASIALLTLALFAASDAGAVTVTRTVDPPGLVPVSLCEYCMILAIFTFDEMDFAPGSVISDVDVSITWLKTDGSCEVPEAGLSYHEETNFRLDGPGGNVILAKPQTWSGGEDIGLVTTVFDQAAEARPRFGTPVSGRFLPNDGNLDAFNGASGLSTFTLRAGDIGPADPLCVDHFSITVTADLPQINMGDPDANTCNAVFRDDGGSGNYSNTQAQEILICSDDGRAIRADFSSFQTEAGFDGLWVWDGRDPTTLAPANASSDPTLPSNNFLFDGNTSSSFSTFWGANSPGTVIGTSGCLGFYFSADGTSDAPGWEATLSCVDVDYGDALDAPGGPAAGNPFATLFEHNGARHAGLGAFLGAYVDTDADGQPNVTANGDDGDGNDDEDGVIFSSTVVAGGTATVAVTASSPGLLNAWIDFNGNGSWADPGEQIFVDEALAAGLNAGLSFAVPLESANQQTYARFRIDQGGGLSFDGPAQDGEVEDYAVVIAPPNADLAITKTDGVASAVPGGSVTYTIVASNPGPSPDPLVSVTDTFSADLTCSTTSVAANGATGNTNGAGDLGDTLSMPAGSSVTYTATCTIDPAATGTLSNTATVTASVTDPDPGNNSATDDDTVLVPRADVSVTKTDGVTTAVPGQTTLTYTIVAANAGPSNDPEVTVADSFPADLTCNTTSVASGGATGNTASGSGDLADTLSMPSGSSVTYTATCTIDPAATGMLSNTATVAASVEDPDGDNDSATDDTELAPDADLAIDKIDSEDPVVGLAFAYTLEVTNHGPSSATNVEATDTLPTGMTFISSADGCTETLGVVTCPFGMMAVDETLSRTFEVEIEPGLSSPLSNTATVASAADDSVPGNDSDTEETALDTEPPVVSALDTVAGSGDGELAECEVVRVPIGGVRLTVTDDLSPLVGLDDPASYRLVGTGPDGDFSTTGCDALPAGDDVEIEIVSLSLVSADPIEGTVTASTGSLEAGLYRLLVCDTIADEAGNALDGDGDGGSGGDLERHFRADPLNLVVNGHFDDCPGASRGVAAVTLEPWVPVATPPDAIAPGAPGDDAAGSPRSSSASFTSLTPDPLLLGQCVELDGAPSYDLDASYRLDAAPGVAVLLQLLCEQFDGAGCAGASLGSAATALLVENTGGAWVAHAAELAADPAALSALCDASFQPVDPAQPAFEAGLDAVFLGRGPEIFANGFESGDTSGWTSTVP